MVHSGKKILIAAGGTGGHLLPAQQLATSLQGKAALFFAGHGLTCSPFFKRELYSFREIPASPLRKNIFSFFKTTFSGIVRSIQLIRSERPDVVVGFGSFHCFPVLMAALLLRKRIVLFEANCQLGKVNRFFSPFARIAMQFAEPSAKVARTPLLPWREQEPIDPKSAREEYGLFPEKTTLLVFGGSQGASFLNTALPSVLPAEVQVLHLTGREEWVGETARAYRERNIFSVVKSFESTMAKAYAAADAAVCRSGAGTIAELIRYGVPALLIPFPYATDNHQETNAEFLAKKIGGATMLNQKDAQHLPVRIATLLSERENMRAALRLFAKQCEERVPFWKQILENPS